MKKAMVAILIISLFLIACQGYQEVPETSFETTEPLNEPLEDASPPTEEDAACTNSDSCTPGKLCIESQCQYLEKFYEVDSTCKKCKFSKITLLTSDGETYEVAPGQGGYTAASALEWEVVPGKEYCQGQTPTIPIEILKRNYNTIYNQEIILLQEGETSEVITHPIVKKLAFTIKITKVEETCS